MAGGRSDSSLPAAAPRARNHQRCFLRALVGRSLRDAATLRCKRRVGAHFGRQGDSVHGGAHHLCEAHRPMGGGPTGAPCRPQPGLRQVASDGVGLGRASGWHAGALEGNQRTHAAGALRHDGDWHGPVKPAARRAPAGKRGHSAAGRRAAACG